MRRGNDPPRARFYNFPALSASESFVTQHPDVAAGAVRAIVKTQKALMAEPSLATRVGRQIFPGEEAEIISTLVERDAPFYGAGISQDAVDGLNKFCLARALTTKHVPYEQLIATQLKAHWEG